MLKSPRLSVMQKERQKTLTQLVEIIAHVLTILLPINSPYLIRSNAKKILMHKERSWNL